MGFIVKRLYSLDYRFFGGYRKMQDLWDTSDPGFGYLFLHTTEKNFGKQFCTVGENFSKASKFCDCNFDFSIFSIFYFGGLFIMFVEKILHIVRVKSVFK